MPMAARLQMEAGLLAQLHREQRQETQEQQRRHSAELLALIGEQRTVVEASGTIGNAMARIQDKAMSWPLTCR